MAVRGTTIPTPIFTAFPIPTSAAQEYQTMAISYLMPTSEINFHNGADGKKGYRAHFSHDNEAAAPGYYKVHLDSTNIEVELTVSKRSGMHKYHFPDNTNQIVILDLVHRDQVLDAKIEKISDTEIVGYRHSKAWATNQMLFFAIETSHPFNNMLQSPH
jgi:putative alpha-1,2-mannosidase